MKVTFEKEIDLSQVPFEVSKTFKESLSQLTTLSDMLQGLDPTKPTQFVEKLDFVRGRLFDIDSSFDECSSQMRGYVNALENVAPQSPPEEVTTAKLEEVTEKNMKNIMDATHAASPIPMPDPSEVLRQMKAGDNK